MSAKEKTLDVKIRIEDEPIIAVGNAGKNKVNALHAKGINTVEEFLNCDVRMMSQFEEGRRKYRILQDVLSCKYLGTPLLRASYLDSQYAYGKNDHETNLVYIVLGELGFSGTTFMRGLKKKMNGVNTTHYARQIKIIDIIKKYFPDGQRSYTPLVNFYIEYYDKYLRLEEARKNPQKYLKEARKELAELVIKRDEYNEQIETLTARIQELEQGVGSHEL